jgi:hypothetical protein
VSKQDEINAHFSEDLIRIYDVLISLTERVDKIEAHLCAKCNEINNEKEK